MRIERKGDEAWGVFSDEEIAAVSLKEGDDVSVAAEDGRLRVERFDVVTPPEAR